MHGICLKINLMAACFGLVAEAIYDLVHQHRYIRLMNLKSNIWLQISLWSSRGKEQIINYLANPDGRAVLGVLRKPLYC
jgi:hypothetical protein